MKIVIINGSPRKRGATAAALHRIEQTLSEQGAEVIYIDLCEKKIAPCVGCCACFKLGHCVIDDDADKLSALLESADGVMMGSSTFASNVPGTMKTFIDRGHFVIEQLLHRKYALCITTYENYGGPDALKVLKRLVTLSGASLTGAMAYRLPFNSDAASDAALVHKADRLALRLFRDIKGGRAYLFQRVKQWLVINVGLKRFILSKREHYAGVRRRWMKLGLLSSGRK